MRKRSAAALVMLVIASIAGTAVWNLQTRQPLLHVESGRSDYILENFELTSLDERGNESFSVQAPYLERDPHGKSLSIRLPRFSFPDKNSGRWQANSATAWVAEKGVEVRLNDSVHLIGPPSPLGEQTLFDTEHLQVFPKQDLALSQDFVTIRRADSILHGTGLRADMRSHHIQLLANVKGRYAPRPH